MGSAMSKNLLRAGLQLCVFDVEMKAAQSIRDIGGKNVEIAHSPKELVKNVNTVLSILPNDKILQKVCLGEDGIIHNMQQNGIHISCSTVSPISSRELASLHKNQGSLFIGAPVFARPDGIANKNGTWVISGEERGRIEAKRILKHTCSSIYEFGDDPGAGNVVKLSGNFMIAAAIESMGEALALCENNNLDREEVMKMFSDTIFNCLIYKGYGNRIQGRKHFQDNDHPGFALDLGLKDIQLVVDTAKNSNKSVPMPFASLLRDRLTAAKNKGRGDLDWSAIGMSISEDAGVDVSDFVKNPRPE